MINERPLLTIRRDFPASAGFTGTALTCYSGPDDALAILATPTLPRSTRPLLLLKNSMYEAQANSQAGRASRRDPQCMR